MSRSAWVQGRCVEDLKKTLVFANVGCTVSLVIALATIVATGFIHWWLPVYLMVPSAAFVFWVAFAEIVGDAEQRIKDVEAVGEESE